jgi:hypothetical protein
VANKARRRNKRNVAAGESPGSAPAVTGGRKLPAPPNGAGVDHATQSENHARFEERSSLLLLVFMFIWDFLGDWKRLIGVAFLILVIAFALLLIFGGLAALIYIATLHVPVAAKIAISSGSVALALGTALVGGARVGSRGGRRDR